MDELRAHRASLWRQFGRSHVDLRRAVPRDGFRAAVKRSTLAGAFLAAGLVDELLPYVAPVLLGDSARPLFAGLGIEAMAQRAHLKVADTRAIGEDQRVLLQLV